MVTAPRKPPRGGWPLVGRALFAYLVLGAAVGKALSKYSEEIPFGGSPWSAGEWLVSYADGFVRRGLFGELFLRVAPGGQAGLWLLYGIQMSLLLVVVAYGVSALHRSAYSWATIALVCGPVGIPFVGWGDSSFHKEFLPFVVLALLAWARRPGRRRGTVVVLVVAALALFVLAVFSWEASALLLPGMLYLLVARGAPHASLDVFRRSVAAVFVVVGGTGAVISTLIHGDAQTAHAVCEAARARGFVGPELCGAVGVSGGGIEAIGWTSFKTSMDLSTAFPAYFGFLPLIALGFLPVVLSRWFRRNWIWGALAFLAVAPLYVVVTDYGRWTTMIVVGLMFCITADDPEGAYSPLWNWMSGIAYVSLWGMPHWVSPTTDVWPFLGFGSTVLDYLVEYTGLLLQAL